MAAGLDLRGRASGKGKDKEGMGKLKGVRGRKRGERGEVVGLCPIRNRSMAAPLMMLSYSGNYFIFWHYCNSLLVCLDYVL